MHLKDVGKLIVGAVVVVGVGRLASKLLPRLDTEDVGADRVLSRASDSASEISPRLAASPRGDVALAWMALRGGKDGDVASHIGVRTSADRGATWGDISRLVSPGGRLSAEPCVGFFHEAPLYAWIGFRRGPRGESFDAAVYSARDSEHVVRINAGPDTGAAFYSQLASASAAERTYLAFRRVEGGAAAIVLASSADGTSFESQSLSDGGEAPTVCASGDRVVVAWTDPSAGVTVAASENRGKSFTRFVASTYREHLTREAPSCVLDDADVFVAYGSLDLAPASTPGVSPADYVTVLRSHDGGKTTIERSTVRPGSKMLHPTLSLRSSGVLELGYLAGATDGDPRGHFGVASVGVSGQTRPARSLHVPVVFATKRADMAWGGECLGLASTDRVTLAAVVDTVTQLSDAGVGVERHIVLVPVPEE